MRYTICDVLIGVACRSLIGDGFLLAMIIWAASVAGT